MGADRRIRLGCTLALVGTLGAGCGGGGSRGAASPSDLGQQLIATSSAAGEPEVADYDALFPDAALLGEIPYDAQVKGLVRRNPDPSQDAQRIRDAWQVTLDLLITEDALTRLAQVGQPVVRSEGPVPTADITFSFGQAKGTFRVTAAEIGGRWFIVDAGLDEVPPGSIY